MKLTDIFRRRPTDGRGTDNPADTAMPEAVTDAVREQRITSTEIQNAATLMQQYRQGKANLEARVIADELWYKQRHWEVMQRHNHADPTNRHPHDVQPTSGWLFNVLANKHADAMDNYPEPTVLPREQADEPEAEMLSDILPVVMEMCGFEETYSDAWDNKLRGGTGVYGVFWDGSANGGLGDIAIRSIDILNIFWEPGVTDIQRSRNVFHAELQDNDALTERYPELIGKLSGNPYDLSSYVVDDNIDVSDKSMVVDWYYKRINANGKQVLHYCKFCGDVVLYATENDPAYAEDGWYAHGKYPFVFDPLFRVEGTPAGFGYIDLGKSAQEYIDRGNQAILQNMLANTKPRYFIRSDGSINEAEFADMDKPFVHVDGQLGQDSIMPINGKSLSDIYVAVVNNKIDELKEITGNRDISTGGTSGGVTAASAIAAMQEAGSKLSRDNIRASYRAYRQVCELCIELIRQFYDLPRWFRIVGRDGQAKYIQYSNAGIAPQLQGGNEYGVDMGYRLPVFDLQITASKSSPYSKLAQNELALQFFGAGFFAPQMAQQAIMCLDMMDFDGKSAVMQKIAQNGAAYDAFMAQQAMMGAIPPAAMAQQPLGGGGAEMPEGGVGESSVTQNARERVANSTSPV